MKKYELTKEFKLDLFGQKIFRIKALISFSNVIKGELGGFIGKEENLSHEGNAWVSGDAKVSGDARVSGNAKVSGNAEVSGDARVSGKVLNIDYEKYNITATDNNLKIGCKNYSFEEWWNFTDKEIIAMDGKEALKWWRKWKPILQQILEVN